MTVLHPIGPESLPIAPQHLVGRSVRIVALGELTRQQLCRLRCELAPEALSMIENGLDVLTIQNRRKLVARRRRRSRRLYIFARRYTISSLWLLERARMLKLNLR